MILSYSLSYATEIDSTKYSLVKNSILVEVNKDLIRYDKCKEESILLKTSIKTFEELTNEQVKQIKSLDDYNKKLQFRNNEKDTLLSISQKENENIRNNFQKNLKQQKQKSTMFAVKTGAGAIILGFIVGLLIN